MEEQIHTLFGLQLPSLRMSQKIPSSRDCSQMKPTTQFSNEFDILYSVQFSHSVMSDSATPQTAARQASLSITNSRNLLKLTSIESVMPSNHLILCRPLLLPPSIFPSISIFANQSILRIRWSSIEVSASASALPMNIQDLFPLGWTGWISLLSKGLSRVFSSTTAQKHQLFCTQPSLWSNSQIHT